MTTIILESFERDGKKLIIHALIGDRRKALSKAELMKAIELVLPEGNPRQQDLAFSSIEKNGD